MREFLLYGKKYSFFCIKPNIKFISKVSKNFGSLISGSKKKPLIRKVSNLIGGEVFSFWITLGLVFLLLTFKGSTGEGQPILFSNIVKEYVEETSITIAGYAQPPMQFAEISALAIGNTDSLGQGNPGQGGSGAVITPSPINDNSILASNPASTDYIEASGFTRSSITEYIVQPGDLLSFIASDFGVSVSSIIWANGLKDADSLRLGQVLKIPPISGVIHLVKKGDTIASMAKEYGADEAKILEFNALPQNGILAIGDEIIIPNGKIKSTFVSSGSTAKPFSYLPNLGDYFIQPVTGYNWGRIHGRNGVDVANSCGTPIYAAADGSVTIADASGYNGGFGKYIKIVHPNGTETLYAHATQLLVFTGQVAQKGQKIALMGSTGRSTGCHLHFEVHGARNPLAR